MKYYLHDSNAFSDEKISELYIEFGYEGLGLFYTILEKIAAQEKPIKTKVLKNQLKVGKKLNKCWEFMERIELISSNNGETFNKQLLNFSGKYAIKKEKNKKRIAEWREKQELTKNVTHYEHVCNTPKVKESKVKESKTIKADYDFSFVDENFKDSFKKWIEYKKGRSQAYKTQSSLEACYNKLLSISAKNPKIAEECVNDSMANNYSGLFAPKKTYIHPIANHTNEKKYEQF